MQALFRKYIEQFTLITETDWEEFLPLLQEKTIGKGDFFQNSGEMGIKLGFIISGILRTYFVTEDGVEYTTDFCTANTISANYSVLMDHNPQDFLSQALTEVVMLEFDYGKFEKLCLKNKTWDNFRSKQVELYYIEKIKREKELLALTADKKYRLFIEKYKTIVENIPQIYIASYLGITPETLSRIKKSK